EEEEEEEKLLFGKIPRTPGLIGIAVVLVVILVLLAALVSGSFGFRGGISSINVNIPNSEGELDDEEMTVKAETGTPAFGKEAEGDGDLTIYYNDLEVYTAKFKFSGARGTKSIPYEDFYVDNGEYIVEIKFEGKTESDTIILERTAHALLMLQFDSVWNEEERVRYSISFLPEEGSPSDILVPGHGHIEIYYVENEADQDNEDQWENVTKISITTDFGSIEYNFEGEPKEQISAAEGFFIDFPASKLMEKNDDKEGYYSARVYFTNDYGLTEYDAFRGWISTMPDQDPDTSYTWVKLGDEE
ncbi:MAG: hypothetical protein KAU14_04915, partial [Thermoplasmata archaeon]|nr:hypothetical protein [Thermoplasmata archaeon]